MTREYANRTDTIDDAIFFRGLEAEHTPAYGTETIFIVGIQPVTEILQLVEKYCTETKNITHVCFGANKSFNPANNDEWEQWENMIRPLLKEDLWVTLDFDVKYAEQLHECGLTEYRRFIPIISITLPYISLFNYNTVVKIADKGFDESNPGVWCHSLHDLMDNDKFTNFDQYKEDRLIK
jgi:hypothetical protein